MNQEDDNTTDENNGSAPVSDSQPETSSGNDSQEVREESSGSDEVDVSSIDALAPDEESAASEGEYNRSRASVPQSPDKTASVERAPEQDEGTATGKDNFFIPILRTYQSDARDVAETKGGAELRTVLAKEAEEKRAAQQEYIKKTKDLVKESAVLKDSYRNFKKKKEKRGEILTETKTGVVGVQGADLQQVSTTVSGALAYMQSAAADDGAKGRETDSTSPQGQDKTPGNAPPKKSAAVKQDISSEVPDMQPQSDLGKKKGVFSEIRGRALPEDTFSEDERASMKKEEEDIVEKESIDSAWKDFQRKKQELKDKGAVVRDVRSYTATSAGSTPSAAAHRLKQWGLVGFVILLIGSLLFIISSIALRPSEIPSEAPSEPSNELQAVRDVISSEDREFVDVSATPNTWPAIVERGDESGAVTKFVPYEIREGRSVQIGLDDLNLNFIMRIPPGLRETLGDYYFVGKHTDETTANGILIVSVKDYGDALVWMLNWEKNAINSFISVFPDTFNRSNSENTSVTSTIIDNKDVRILRNPLSSTPLMYYFFNRSVLVFVTGSERTIPIINDRIRAANAQ